MGVLVGAIRDAAVSSVLLCMQTFITRLSSPLTLCMDSLVVVELREREQGWFDLMHLSHLLDVGLKMHFFFALRHAKHAI